MREARKGISKFQGTLVRRYEYTFTCKGCGEVKTREFLCMEDFENDEFAKADICFKCVIEGKVTLPPAKRIKRHLKLKK